MILEALQIVQSAALSFKGVETQYNCDISS
jgi:hypothetical protein